MCYSAGIHTYRINEAHVVRQVTIILVFENDAVESFRDARVGREQDMKARVVSGTRLAREGRRGNPPQTHREQRLTGAVDLVLAQLIRAARNRDLADVRRN